MKKVKINGIIYGVRDSEVLVCGFDKDNCPAYVRVEYEVSGRPVTQIRKGAFEYSDIAVVELPSTINTISSGAFFACHFLERVSEYVVDTAKYVITANYNLIRQWIFIDDNAFANCESLNTVEFKKFFRYVYPSAFENCTNLKNLYVQLGHVRKDAFKNCAALTEIYLCKDTHLSNDSIEESAISKITAQANFSYTTLLAKYMKNIPVRICCPATSPIVELAYEGFAVELI